MNRMTFMSLAILLAVLGRPAIVAGETVSLDAATVITPGPVAGPERNAVRMLIEEVDVRSRIRWSHVESWPNAKGPKIVVGRYERVRELLQAQSIKVDSRLKPEGFAIGVARHQGETVVWIAGHDERGVLFGVGRLLRELSLARNRITLDDQFQITTAPTTPLRGHQLGYRPKTNSYDGWTAAMWEQYFRDLIVFGCNAIELIPPRSDDDADSSLFPWPPLRMMVEMSRLANEYGLDVWIWYPAMDRDYSDPATMTAAVKEWGEVFRALPRIDAVFVPGGDPGHTRPKVLFDLLERQSANLKRYHPRAAMWMSPQSFNREWTEEFLSLVRPPPSWLSGIVFGPQNRLPLSELRAALPAAVPIRDYPDITHSMRCQYPVPDWDVAWALTEGREVVNPRPVQTARMFRYGRQHTSGFITYSEGCHDDVNKMIWSALGWDANADIAVILKQYGRYFISPEIGDRYAEGLVALEQNWMGPVEDNRKIPLTTELFRDLERKAGPREKTNWRFQQTLYRAYYDSYVQRRLTSETARLNKALSVLKAAKPGNSLMAIREAETILGRSASVSPTDPLRIRVGELAEGLFQSIRAQLSVSRYHAIAVGRGANYDSIDVPLTDVEWWLSEFAKLKTVGDEAERHTRLFALLNRTDPGPGGYYDNFGDAKRQPHLVRGPGWERDPSFDHSPVTAFVARGGPPPVMPRAWWHYAEIHYDTPLKAHYDRLDPDAKYRLRIVYGPQDGRKVRLQAGAGLTVHEPILKPFTPLEYDLPHDATRSGKLTLTWTQESGSGGPGRGCHVCEVWVIRK